ncbi:MAG: hypothetical protein M3N30_00870 [Bacteroidota bacterium]|nr:hypothetical protein [Bacteroidota bacterium]
MIKAASLGETDSVGILSGTGLLVPSFKVTGTSRFLLGFFSMSLQAKREAIVLSIS